MIDKTKYLIIGATTILISLIAIYFVITWQKKDVNQQLPETTTPIPTLTLSPMITISERNSSKIIVSTTPLPQTSSATPEAPESLGGDISIPPPQITAGYEMETLIKMVPVITADFVIRYDYAKAKFRVVFTNSKPNNNDLFEEWIMQNYPSVQISEFIFTN